MNPVNYALERIEVAAQARWPSTSWERFLSKVDVGGSTDCWPWTGTFRNGYGIKSAHRRGYELLVGPIPGDYTLDHLCRNRACCNPAHLELVTRGENVARGNRSRAATRTLCQRGHPLDNVGDRRKCLTCHRASRRKVT